MKTDRIEFPKHVREAAWQRADGKCEECGQDFGQRRPEYDHRIPLALHGTSELSNCMCVCPPCHRLKTTTEDIPRITKAKSVERKRANLNPKPSRPIGRRGASNVRDISEERGNG